jgi:hypothetical protein
MIVEGSLQRARAGSVSLSTDTRDVNAIVKTRVKRLQIQYHRSCAQVQDIVTWYVRALECRNLPEAARWKAPISPPTSSSLVAVEQA